MKKLLKTTILATLLLISQSGFGQCTGCGTPLPSTINTGTSTYTGTQCLTFNLTITGFGTIVIFDNIDLGSR